MVLSLRHSRPAAAGPEKAAVANVKCFDPLRGYLLYLLDEISLGNSKNLLTRFCAFR
jgi:hypothetical protein